MICALVVVCSVGCQVTNDPPPANAIGNSSQPRRRTTSRPSFCRPPRRRATAPGRKVTFNREAQERFLPFATAPDAAWTGNFRDLNAAVTRMATLAAGGRISVAIVDEEIERLRHQWGAGETADPADLSALPGRERLEAIDPFDRVQLAEVVAVCRRSRFLSEAGRFLFSVSRRQKKSPTTPTASASTSPGSGWNGTCCRPRQSDPGT